MRILRSTAFASSFGQTRLRKLSGLRGLPASFAKTQTGTSFCTHTRDAGAGPRSAARGWRRVRRGPRAASGPACSSRVRGRNRIRPSWGKKSRHSRDRTSFTRHRGARDTDEGADDDHCGGDETVVAERGHQRKEQRAEVGGDIGCAVLEAVARELAGGQGHGAEVIVRRAPRESCELVL
jgi:hypothetical protein